MARSAGLAPRRGYQLDRELVLLGAVQAGPRGEAAETRTGAARVLSTPLEAQNVFKAVLFGQTATVAGGYLIQVAHVDEGDTSPDVDYVTVGTIEGSGTTTVELALSGKDIYDQVLDATDGAILTLDTLVGGSGYTNATYTDVPLTGGTGSGATADIVVSGGAVTSVTIVDHGKNYVVDDELSAADANLGGGGGSGFTIDVATIKSITEPRAAAVKLVAGTGSNGAAIPAGTMTIALMPAE